MKIHTSLLRSIALSLVVLVTLQTVPFADAAPAVARIGSVSAVGAAQLRGIPFQGEGTLFPGDPLKVGPGAYAKLLIGTGARFEVGANSSVIATQAAGDVQIRMESGNVAFRGSEKSAIRIQVGSYEIAGKGDSSGNIAYIGKEAFGVRVLSGTVQVRNTETKQSFVVTKGAERIVGLKAGAPSYALLASTSPSPVPALPSAQTPPSGNTMLYVLIGAAAGGAALIGLLVGGGGDDPTTPPSTALAQLKSNVTAVASTATATTTLATAVSNTASTAITQINISTVGNKSTLLTDATAARDLAVAAIAKVTAMNSGLSSFQSTLAGQTAVPTSAQVTQLNTLVTSVNSARVDANTALANLLTLLTQATNSGVLGIPAAPTLQAIAAPTIASVSVP